MDIHRSRFVPYAPSAINSLAFSHTSGRTSSNQPLRLAIGRANGQIEIWNPLRGCWVHETTMHGGKGRSVEALVWTHDPDVVETDGETGKTYRHYGRARLFSIGYSSAVTEWDLITGRPRRESSGVGGEVWCLAAQPAELPTKGADKKKKGKRKRESPANGNKTTTNAARDAEPAKNTEQAKDVDPAQPQHLVAGCADGTLVLLSTADDDLVFSKYIARASKKNARALSLAFQDRYTVVAGFADSTLRVYDIRSGALIRNMSLGAGPSGGPKEKLVWAVECLKDGTVVSGDSSGEVVFWDAKTFGQLQRIKGHEADVLCLTSNVDGDVVFSGGMDRRTCVYGVSGEKSAGQRRRWMKSSHRRFHQHDVKAMARFENVKMSVVVSGGLDTSPVLIPLREFGTEYHRVLPFVPQTPPVTGAGRLVVSWKENEVVIWRIRTRTENVQDDALPDDAYHVVARLALKGDEFIATAALAPCGRVLAVSTAAETKLFQLRQSRAGMLKVRKMDDAPKYLAAGSRIVEFSPDSKWLLTITTDNQIRLVRALPTTDPDGKQKLSFTPKNLTLRRLRREQGVQNSFNGVWGSYERTIVRATFSSSSRILAVSDLAGYTDVFVLEGAEDAASELANTTPSTNGPELLSPPDSEAESSDAESSDSSSTSAIAARRQERKAGLCNQRWVLNPASRLLPRLPSHALIFSFRPSLPPSTSESDPEDTNPDDTLLILTAIHTLYAFHALAGLLTPWSRRNPSALLPAELRLQRDRATGCVWDVSAQTARLWLYSASWLAMLDLSADFPRPVGSAEAEAGAKKATDGLPPGIEPTEASLSRGTAGTKRKLQNDRREDGARRTARELDTKKGTTGAAGSRMPLSERAAGVYTDEAGSVRTMGVGGWEDVHVSRGKVQARDPFASDNSSEDEHGDEGGYYPRLTDGASTAEVEDGEDDEGDADGEVDAATATTTRRRRRPRNGPPSFYITQRYRPILGVIPLSDSAGDEHAGSGSAESAIAEGVVSPTRKLEVALFERPFWDLQLPARFAGAQEWGEK